MPLSGSETTVHPSMIASLKAFFNRNNAPIKTLVGIILYITVSFLVFKYSSLSELSTYSTAISVVFVVGLFLGALLFFNQTDLSIKRLKQPTIMKQLGYLLYPLSTILIGLFTVFGILYFISSYDLLSSGITYLLLFGSIIGGLYLIHNLMSKTPLYAFIKNNPILRMIYHVLFIIPCFIVEGGADAVNSSKNTPIFIYKILAAEVLFIAAYFLLPMLDSYIYTHDANVLLKGPIFLDFQKKLGTYEELKQGSDFKYSYGLSFWSFIDQNSPNLNNSSITDAPILNYGGNPNITFNAKKQQLKITMQDGLDGTKTIYTNSQFPLQKWNNFVINYTNGTLDIFLNGALIATDKNAVSYMTLHDVVSGTEHGLQGGIKNVLYFKEPLSKYKIQMLYSHYK